ncbi:ribose phosphate diphosphokinase Prs1 [Rhizodiscina lignyota]|uniref:Ribose-phosphate pyrophosphokinase 1 n=1 Tax=Rhizodiscina lignyota TaxID=1504668 RepID=A0A9P4ILX4_9PEZI|nr:ribose phosphate diphosphokinase Prs1 [Rhizodiscina lignyota]
MRQAQIFSGSSHPALVEGICDRLGQKQGKAELSKFSNGETSVQILTSIRDQDVYIVQSGSSRINDNLVELLIMISACKGGSAKSITAVMPYFPYCRQSKKKSHRGAITARMVANLLHVAGVSHVITIDLHASQMQGFFKCTVDNLVAEPLIARWIKTHIRNWQEAVVVSKNAGGTKRVTSLADALKLSFGIVTTDRRRFLGHHLHDPYSMAGSMILEKLVDGLNEHQENGSLDSKEDEKKELTSEGVETQDKVESDDTTPNGMAPPPDTPDTPPANDLRRSRTEPTTIAELEEEFTDERARDVITGRLIHGHIVDEEEQQPSPSISAASASATPRLARISGYDGMHSARGGSSDAGDPPEHMMSSFISTTSSFKTQSVIGGHIDVGATSEEEEEDLQDSEVETMVTLVGNVRDRPVFLIDDMIDKSGSWVAAAETVIKRGGATKVYCFATHGLFGDNCLEELESCECIEKIIVTNSFPIDVEKAERSQKLTILDVSSLLSEAIRRNKFGESISQLFMHYD